MCRCFCMARMWILQKADLGLLERREADSPRSCRRMNCLTLETPQRWEVPLKSFLAARVWSCAIGLVSLLTLPRQQWNRPALSSRDQNANRRERESSGKQ